MNIFYGNVINNRLSTLCAEAVAIELKKHNTFTIQITIERAMEGRTNKQNRYLHMMLTIFQQELNKLGNDFTIDEVKDICKLKFARQKIYNVDTGEVIGEKLKETSKMTSKEISRFTEQIRQWAAEYFHIQLPLPNETI
jgi:hypothetical protein